MVYPLVFCSLNRIIGFAEDTHARKKLKKYLVFCSLNRIIGFAEDTHARKNLKNIWFFARLIVSLPPN